MCIRDRSQTVGAVNITGPGTIQDGTLTGTSYTDSATSGIATVNAILGGVGSTLTQSGAGTLVLGNMNTYTGGTTISAGTLLVGNSGALGSGAVNQSGGNLGTSGAGGIQINMPGGYTQSGGTLTLQLNAAPVGGLNAANDLLNVTGSAALNGGLTVKFNFVPAKGDLFTVVETTTGITSAGAGYLTPITSPAGYQVTGSILPGGDDFSVDVTSVNLQLNTIPGIFLTPNQTNIALYLANPNLATTNPALFNAFQTIIGNPQAVEAALDQLSPEKFANFARSTIINLSLIHIWLAR